MKRIILIRGIPASGKSTWAKQEVLKDPEHSVRINRDDLRNMSGQYWVPAREGYIIACRNQLLNLAICVGFDTIILDDMNLNPKDFEYVSIVIDKVNKIIKDTKILNEINTKLNKTPLKHYTEFLNEKIYKSNTRRRMQCMQ